MSRCFMIAAAVVGLAQAPAFPAAATAPTTVLYDGKATQVERAILEQGDLWITVGDLQRITGFELKPQGACREDVCIPVTQRGAGSLVRTERREKWFNATAFARKVRQAYVHDADASVWSLGEIPVLRGGFLTGGIAPDFELADRKGRPVRLSGFRGKKVLLLTWASW